MIQSFDAKFDNFNAIVFPVDSLAACELTASSYADIFLHTEGKNFDIARVLEVEAPPTPHTEIIITTAHIKRQRIMQKAKLQVKISMKFE